MVDRQRDSTHDARLDAAHAAHGGFLRGLVGGALIGIAAGVLMAPQIFAAMRIVRRELNDAAETATEAAGEKYHEATTRLGEAVDDVQQKGRGVYKKALNVVVRGAEEVKARATEAQTELDQRTADASHRSL